MSARSAVCVQPSRRWLVPLDRMEIEPDAVGLSAAQARQGLAASRGQAQWRLHDAALGLDIVVAGRVDHPDPARSAVARRTCLRLPELSAAIDAWLRAQGAWPDGRGEARIERLAFGLHPDDPPESLRAAMRLTDAGAGTGAVASGDRRSLRLASLCCRTLPGSGADGFVALGLLDDLAAWPAGLDGFRSGEQQRALEARARAQEARVDASWKAIAALHASGGLAAVRRAADDPGLRPFAVGWIESTPSPDAVATLLDIHTDALIDPAAHPDVTCELLDALHRQFSTPDDGKGPMIDATLAGRIVAFLELAGDAARLPSHWHADALHQLSADVAGSVG